MRGKILVCGLGAVVAAFGLTPAPAQAHGDRVSVKDSYLPGTILIGKYIRPAWSPPDSIRGDYRRLPRVVPGGSGSNPMGAAAMTLSGGGEYAIHGTNAPGTIGGFVSHGCIRMYNEDIMDLYSRVSIGTRVVVTR